MPGLSQLTRQKPVEKLIDVGDGDTVTIVFDRNAITPAWVASAQVNEDDSDPYTLPKALAAVLISWDVTDDTGAVLVPTAETIGLFSMPAQSALLDQILAAAIPSSAEGNASESISSTASMDSASLQATPQNGPTPSMSPPLSTSPST